MAAAKKTIKFPRDIELKRVSVMAGIPRLSAKSHDFMRKIAQEATENIMREAVVYASYAKRKTIMPSDIKNVLKRRGISYLG